MNIIMWLICMWYMFQIGLRKIQQPKELYAWEEIQASHENYFIGMTVKQMVRSGIVKARYRTIDEH